MSILVLGFITVAGASALADDEPSARDGNWLEVLNGYRETAGLKPVAEESSSSRDATDLARHHLAHESVGQHGPQPGMRAAAARASASSDIIGSAHPNPTGQMVIDRSISSPLHVVGMLHENLSSVGYGSARDPDKPEIKSVAVIDLGRSHHSLGGSQALRVWPPPESVVPALRHAGGSVPDPLDYCARSTLPAPTGAAIVVWWPRPIKNFRATVKVNGVQISECVITADQKSHSGDSTLEAMVERVLGTNIAIIVPQNPIPPGATTWVNVGAAKSEDFDWTFRTAGLDAPIGLGAN